MSEDSGNNKTQLEQQLDLLFKMNEQVPCNPQGDSIKSALTKLLKALQGKTLSESLRDSFEPEQLKKWKVYAQKEFNEMGRINRLRLQSLVELSDEEMHRTMFEGLMLFDINPEDAPPLEVQEKTGEYDGDGKPVIRTIKYDVFQKGAIHGIEGLERFLPKSIIEGEGGMDAHLQQEFEGTDLVSHFKQGSGHLIKALTTIGSLGGIGHKPDSDMDAQVIINTNPEFQFSWNDGDFLVAMVSNVLEKFYDDYIQTGLEVKERIQIKNKAIETLQGTYKDGLSPEEKGVIDVIFASSYRKESRKLIQEHLLNRPAEEQIKYFQNAIISTIQKNPDSENLIESIKQFFPFLQKSGIDLQKEGFPYSLKQYSKDKILTWLTEFYHTSFLDEAGVRQILWRYAVKNNIPPDDVPEDKKKDCFETSLASNAHLDQLIIDFFSDLVTKVAFTYRSKISEAFEALKQHFSSQNVTLEDDLESKILLRMDKDFSYRMVNLIETFSEGEAQDLEADIEYPLHLKIQQAEAYLTKKYPTTEIHFFTNIMRKQRAGQHTPFLVSPEGSMAYALMLNDFLLNPAAMMSGISPMPFDLPKSFKVLSSIGIFPESDWTLHQSLAAEYKAGTVTATNEEGSEESGDEDSADNSETESEKTSEQNLEPEIPEGETETFVLGKLPNWGEIIIPREMFLEHALPIFLRESEKISHRNLPKALLNCWWLEMIVCIDHEDDLPTSLARLLWNPDGRHFIKNDMKGPLVDSILLLEHTYPALALDPWWLKFTEMLVRFESYLQPEEEEPDFALDTLSITQKNIIFCFAQHMRISDIINFGDEGRAVWLDDSANWRTKAMVDFYEIFYSNPEDRMELIRFSQGRDDIGNKMEKLLKLLFLESMNRVEKKLCSIGHERALKRITDQLARLSEKDFVLEKGTKFLNPLLSLVNQRVSIEDRKVLVKLKKKIPLNKIEQMQAKIVYEELQKLKSVQGNIVSYFEQYDLNMEEKWVRDAITKAKVGVAGDPLENVIFKFHFERNFERKPFQVPLPISKSLSIPRDRMKVDFNPKSGKWKFSSMLSKKDAGGSGGSDESELPMFEANLVEAIARCTFSGYVGFGGTHLSTFEKPPAKVHNEVATNPVTGEDLFNLANVVKTFFKSFNPSSKELMENIHYLKDILMVCHYNRLNTLSLIVRDNLGEQFVINFDIRKIDIKKVPPKLRIGGDDALAEFFLRLNSQQCRVLFMRHLAALKIPLLTSHQPKLKIVVNGGKFNLPIAPKFQQRYLDGIANTLWPSDSIGTREHLKPPPLSQTFDEIGRGSLHDK